MQHLNYLLRYFLSLYGENPRAMLDFALNLVNAGDESSQVSLKIKANYQRVFFGKLIHIDGEDALKTDTAGFGLVGDSSTH